MNVIDYGSKHNVDGKCAQTVYIICTNCRAVILINENELGSCYDTATSRSYVEVTCPECGHHTVIWGKRVRR